MCSENFDEFSFCRGLDQTLLKCYMCGKNADRSDELIEFFSSILEKYDPMKCKIVKKRTVKTFWHTKVKTCIQTIYANCIMSKKQQFWNTVKSFTAKGVCFDESITKSELNDKV